MAKFNTVWKNSEGYTDETFGRAYEMTMPARKQIWKNSRGMIVLVIKHQNTYSNTLALVQDISYINSNHVVIGNYYTDPGMMTYMLDRDASEKIGQISEDEYSVLMDAIMEKLDIHAVCTDENELLKKAEEKVKKAQQAAVEAERKASEATNTANQYKAQYDHIIEKLVARFVG